MMEWQSATPVPNLARDNKDPNWEQRQRLKEYRVASRREKRNRKADEKKQRKLNATILRRMTKNPDKYTRNAERNRLQAIDAERRKIWREAMKQVQCLASIYDPSGSLFNIGPVVTCEDGTVMSLEAICQRKEKETAGQAKKNATVNAEVNGILESDNTVMEGLVAGSEASPPHSMPQEAVSKTPQREISAYKIRIPSSKPMIPSGIPLPEGEENWLALWDLPDEQLEQRIMREKKRKAAERKALRKEQRSGKAERRAARDEKRKVYRELKMEWKVIKEEGNKHKARIECAEAEESKLIALQINLADRNTALERCAELGFTLENTVKIEEIRTNSLNVKGVDIDVDVDLDALRSSDKSSEVKPKTNKKRVDLSAIAEKDGTYIMPTGPTDRQGPEDFIELDVDVGQDYESLNYNHKVRRKLRIAKENIAIQKELLVRERVRNICKEKGIEPPPEFSTPMKPIHLRGQRILGNGLLETEKQERVRIRMELVEVNQANRVLRQQAKQTATEAGLRVHAEQLDKHPLGLASDKERTLRATE